jgi:hypothetical protein
MQVLRVCSFSAFSLPPAFPPCYCPLAFRHQVRRLTYRISSESYPGNQECVVSCHGARREPPCPDPHPCLQRRGISRLWACAPPLCLYRGCAVGVSTSPDDSCIDTVVPRPCLKSDTRALAVLKWQDRADPLQRLSPPVCAPSHCSHAAPVGHYRPLLVLTQASSFRSSAVLHRQCRATPRGLDTRRRME